MKKELNTPFTAQQLYNFHQSVSGWFQEKWSNAEENERYKRGRNWTEAEQAEIEGQGRQAFSIALIPTKLNQFLASQRRNRTSFRVLAAEDPNDEIKAEIATIMLRDVEKRSNFKYLESDVYDSGLSIAYGVFEVVKEKDKFYNDVISVKEVDYKNFVWDINAVEYTKRDAAFMAKVDRMYRHQFEAIYGVQKDMLPGDDFSFGRPKYDYFLVIDKNGNRAMDLVSVITHYQKVRRKYYCVVFDDNMQLIEGGVFKFRTKDEAETKLNELKWAYIDKGVPIPSGEIVEEEKEGIDKYVFTYQGVLEYEETDLEDYPFTVYTSFSFKNEFWTLTDLLKSPQKWIDRLFAQIDYAFGKDIKNAIEINVNALAENETPESAIQKIEDGTPIFVKGGGAITSVKTDGANPQWMLMAQTMQQLVEDMSGGRSFQGLKESAGESGRAISLKQQQGELISALFIDNLFRAKKDLGEKLLWWMAKYDTAQRVIKVGGGEIAPEMAQMLQGQGSYQPSLQTPNAGYVTVNSGGISFLNDMSYELLVSEDMLSETAKEKRMQQMMLAEQANPMLAQLPSWQEVKLSTLDIDYVTRQKILGEMQQMKQRQDAMAQEQMNLEKAKVLAQATPQAPIQSAPPQVV